MNRGGCLPGDMRRMNVNLLKRLVSRLPPLWQQELKRLYYRRQIRHQTFETIEPEFRLLGSLISTGDWVIDIGANVGHYTKKFSELVGPQGRVIAVEPVPDTFALLAANVSLFQYRNVTLINLAASDQTTVVDMQIPRFETGLKNYYKATLTTGNSDLQVMTFALDSLTLPHCIKLIKVDAEGHDPVVLQGMERLLTRDHPTLIVETTSAAVVEHLARSGYNSEKLLGSSNTLLRWLPKGTMSF